MKVSIYRYDPDADDKARMQDVDVDLPEGRDLMTVADVVRQVLAEGVQAVRVVTDDPERHAGAATAAA